MEFHLVSSSELTALVANALLIPDICHIVVDFALPVGTMILVSPIHREKEKEDDLKSKINELLRQLPKMDTYAHPEMELDLGLPKWELANDLGFGFHRSAKCLVLQLPAGHEIPGCRCHRCRNAWNIVVYGASHYNLRIILLADKPLDTARIPHQLHVLIH